jgi:hypothetical protein
MLAKNEREEHGERVPALRLTRGCRSIDGDGRQRNLRAVGDLDEDLRQPAGLRDVRAMSAGNLDRVHAQAVARHPPLPVGLDRRSGWPRCTSMGSQGRARSARHGRLAEGSTGVSTALTRASPRRSRGRETPARGVVLGRVLADPLGVQRRLGVASSSSAKLASGSGTRAASQIWCCGRERVRRRGAVDRPRSARGLPGRRERRPVSG